MPDSALPPPTDDDRRHAACLAMTSAPGLIRFAARYTRSLQDAEDAYQRTMEIALTRAPVTEHRRFMAWLHTVLRNEALAVARARRREGPGVEADVPEAYENALEEAVSFDAVTEWRERYRSIQDGLAGLTEAQRVCLMLQAAGAGYSLIQEITGYTMRKVERSVLEGRARLTAWEVRLASGEACDRLDAAIDRVARARATAKDARMVSRHVRNCGHCRALLRERRESNEWLAGLVPASLLAGQIITGSPDPSPAIAWWERVSGGATVRMGTIVQMAIDLPSSALAKVGAGTAAIAVAGVAGAPMVADAVRAGVPEPATAAIVRGPSSDRSDAGAEPEPAARREVASASERRRVVVARPRPTRRTRTVSMKAPSRSVREPMAVRPARYSAATSSPPPVVQTPPPPASLASTRPSSSAVALEFGP